MTPYGLVCLVLAGTLGWVAIEDARHYRIRNAAIVVLASAVCAAYLAGRPGALVPLGVFIIAGFAALAVAFARGWIGGGDAKLLTVALAFAGPSSAAPFAILLLVCVGLYALGAKVGALPARSVEGRREIPFGPSIAAAWMGLMALDI